MTSRTERMKDLWVLCFGDPYEVAEEFFSLHGVETLTEEREGAVAGMASIVPVSDSLGGRGYYVYGVCVSPEYRGEGIFKRLMRRCEERAREKGFDYLCLIPVSEDIAATYERMGYLVSVALCTDAKGSGAGIVSESADFAEFSVSDGEFSGARCGLLKPIREGFDTDIGFFFPNRMGEC